MAKMPRKAKPKSAHRGHARAKTNTWYDAFIEEMSRSMNVRHAADVAGVDRNTAYARRKSDPAFAERWQKALDEAIDHAEVELYRRSVLGIEKPMSVGGEVITVRDYSDSLLSFLLRAHRPERYKERHELTGKDGAPIEVKHTADEVLGKLARLADETTSL